MENLFYGITEQEKEILLKSFDAITSYYKASDHIFVKSKIIGIVLEGQIDIIKNTYDGSSYIIEEILEGDLFDTVSYPITMDEYEIVAKSNVKILFIDYDDVVNYNRDYNFYYIRFLQNLAKNMAEKLFLKNQRIEILANKTIRNKLLAYFKSMIKNKTTVTFTLPITFTELANYLAIDRSAMNREMKHLKDENLIEITNKKIKLLYNPF